MNDVTLEQALAQLERDLQVALRERDAEAARCTAMRQHLDGAPFLAVLRDAWDDQYWRWYGAAQRLVNG